MRHAHVPPEKRGTVAALAEPVVIEHLKRLGAGERPGVIYPIFKVQRAVR